MVSKLASNKSVFSALALIAWTLTGNIGVLAQGQSGQPFQLGVHQDTQLDPETGFYPAPKMIPQTAVMAKPKPVKPLKANIKQDRQPAQRAQMAIPANIQQSQPLSAGVQSGPPPGVLPPQFLGQWQVMGARAAVQARPEFQSGIENIFSATNSQMWNIAGGNGGYSMSSDTGVQQVQVGKCTASVAYIRYAHQIKNTVAQEAIVLQMDPDGRHFQGKQRISIIKQGEAGPRAQVTYNLSGTRQ